MIHKSARVSLFHSMLLCRSSAWPKSGQIPVFYRSSNEINIQKCGLNRWNNTCRDEEAWRCWAAEGLRSIRLISFWNLPVWAITGRVKGSHTASFSGHGCCGKVWVSQEDVQQNLLEEDFRHDAPERKPARLVSWLWKCVLLTLTLASLLPCTNTPSSATCRTNKQMTHALSGLLTVSR